MSAVVAMALGIVLLIALAASFAAAEAVLRALSKAQIRILEKEHPAFAHFAPFLTSERNLTTTPLLTGAAICAISAGTLGIVLAMQCFGWQGAAYAAVIGAIIILIFCVALPQKLADARAMQLAPRVLSLAAPVIRLLGPIAGLADLIAGMILRVFRVTAEQETTRNLRNEDLRDAVEEMHLEGTARKQDAYRLGGVLDLHELEVYDVMVHRTAMQSVNADEAPEQLANAILNSPYTRLPLWRDSAENIIGIVHAKALLRALHLARNDPSGVSIERIATAPWFVPETTSLQDQLGAFLRNKAHMAIVVDEYGEVKGLVTLEDIIEEIVGDISDEHDVEIQGVRQEADGSVVVNGSVTIRDINRALDWNLPDEEAATIAGLVIAESQIIPTERQAFTFYGKRFIVLKREKNRITQLRIRPAPKVEKAAGDS